MPKIVAIPNPNSIPSTSQLALGDIAINSYEGRAYVKRQGNTGLEIVEIGSNAAIPCASYIKNSDQDIATTAVVTFSETADLLTGDSFGTMASTGVFTFNQSGLYMITINYNTSVYQNPFNAASLDLWGKLNDIDDPNYTQVKSLGIYKGSVTGVVPVNTVGENFRWYSNNQCTIYGTGNAKTRITIVKLS